MNKQKRRKSYEKPKIIYEKELEVQAAVCDSAWVPGGSKCRDTVGNGCVKLRT